ncbi:MAG TPA: adenine deaminase [Rhodospirillaceae bacterium]|nr:MAG: adenine deaminase [Alphaproteobacteria bacterium GWF2_58_20]HAU29522.1 adenine deaminase [Rhodospirillaceae bacterium]
MRPQEILKRRIRIAQGQDPADLVLRNARIFHLVDGSFETADIAISGSTIVAIGQGFHALREIDATGLTAVPGFIDSHVHIESTMVAPSEFERAVLPLGTTTAIADPHEIANVLGVTGIQYMLDSTQGLAMDVFLMLSSCVPATHLETSGATLSAKDLVVFSSHPRILGLAEFMNFPGVLGCNEDVIEKLATFFGKHIDGHAPLLSGAGLCAYISAGIHTEHESTSIPEATEKLRRGMQILIREGSASKEVEKLASLLTERLSPFLGLCTDDRNPLDIMREGHINHSIAKAIAHGAEPLAAYRAASISAARAFRLFDRGLVAPGMQADIVLLEDINTCKVNQVICKGQLVAREHFGEPRLPPSAIMHSVHHAPLSAEDFTLVERPDMPAIVIHEDSLLTDRTDLASCADIAKACVIERHGKNGNIGRGFVSGFSLERGALASSVAHDSHNIIVVGKDDGDMAFAANRIIGMQGGFVAVCDGKVIAELPLPVAGLMSTYPLNKVKQSLEALHLAAKGLGCTLQEPYLQMAFLALPVIPHLKLTDMGLVDVDRFEVLK